MDDDTLRAVQEQAHQLEELTRHPGWAVFVDRLHTEMIPDKKAVLNGMVDDISKYHTLTGRLRGIHFAMEAPERVRGMVLSEIGRREERAEQEAE